MPSSLPPDPARSGRGTSWALWLSRSWTLREILLCVLLCPLAGLCAAWASERLRLEGYVLPGVTLDGASVSGLSRAALEELVQKRSSAVSTAQLRVIVGSSTFPLSASQIAARVEVNDVVSAAMSAGRTGSVVSRVRWRLSRMTSPHELHTFPTFDAVAWERHLLDYEATALRPPREGGLELDEGGVTARAPLPGERLERNGSSSLLLSALRRSPSGPLVLPIVASRPRTTPEMVQDALHRAQLLLKGAITLAVQVPDGAAPGGVQPGPDGSLPEERVTSASLSAALETSVTTTEPPSIEIRFRDDALEHLLEPIRARWEQPATDARFIVDARLKIRIEPSKVQTRLDSKHAAERILAAASTPERRGALQLELAEQPRITTEVAQSLNIRSLVAQFTTHHPCCRPRVKNIHRIADLIDGAVVLPGETFSVNEHVGPRTAANGFVPAPTIVHGEMTDTVGGGVSQFATTIFNAVFNGGYEIVERQPHTFYFPRYPVGHEATLSFPKPDFIFRNDTKSGVLLVAEYGPRHIRVKVFGDNEGRRVKREVSRRFDLVDPPVEWEANDELEVDEQKVLARGAKGWSVTVSRTVIEASGEVRKQSRKVTYNPRIRRLAVHSCKIPQGEAGHTGEPCPEPEEEDAPQGDEGDALPPLDVEPTETPQASADGEDEGN